MKQIEVVAAIITNNGSILCTKRDKHQYDYLSYKYEFPGGKIEEGESPIEALRRELVEELNLHVDAQQCEYLISVEHQYPDFQITLHGFLCPIDHREFDLIEHVEHQWLQHDALQQVDWAAADAPIVERLMNGDW